MAQRQVSPLLKQDLLSILSLMRGTKGIRDRALLLLGFAAALRRSELVALDVRDLSFVSEGVVVHLRRSKTDQESEGRKIAVPYGRTSACPVRALQHWLEHAQINDSAIFRSVSKSGKVAHDRLSAQSVALILKDYARGAGFKVSAISSHSLRSGLVTSAAQAGVAAHKIQQQTGHRSTEMLVRYIRDANLFENNAAGLLL
jgi:site-specific recombinase XerD